MSTPEWKELERLWQRTPAQPALEIIARQQRLRWLSHSFLVSEVVAVLFGLGASVWLMTLGGAHGLAVGVGALLFTLFAGAASLWARLPVRRVVGDSVTAALEAAIHRARIGTRLAAASFAVVAVALLFLAALALMWSEAPEMPVEAAQHQLQWLAFGVGWCALYQIVTIWYYARRLRELARLEEVKRSLAEG